MLHVWLVQVYLITELLTGGELLDAVLQRGSYNEADARDCFVQLLRGIEYLHAKCDLQHTILLHEQTVRLTFMWTGRRSDGSIKRLHIHLTSRYPMKFVQSILLEMVAVRCC